MKFMHGLSLVATSGNGCANPLADRRQAMQQAAFLVFVTLMLQPYVPCFAAEPATSESDHKLNEKASSLPQRTFEAIKSNDPDALADVVITAEDFVALAKLEARSPMIDLSKKELDTRDAQAAEYALRKAKSRLARLREQTTEMGFKWGDAALASAKVDGKAYDPASKAMKVDIMLTIQSGSASIVVKLDDCFFINGRRRIADGFRLQRRR